MRRAGARQRLLSSAIRDRTERTPALGHIVWGPQTGYVLATYGPEDPRNRRMAGVECDIVLDNGERTILCNAIVTVPTSTPVGEAQAWRPTPTQRNLDLGLPLILAAPALYSTTLLAIPDLSALDGDYVLVAFRGGHVGQPYIIRSVTHPRATIDNGALPDVPWPSDEVLHPTPKSGHIRWVYHAGTKVGIDVAGNVFVVTRDAPKTSAEQPSPLTPSGSVTLDLKAESSVTVRFAGGLTAFRIGDVGATGGAKVGIGTAPAEPVILGSTFQAWANTVVNLLKTHIHPIVGAGTPEATIAVSVALQALTEMTATMLSTDVKLTR